MYVFGFLLLWVPGLWWTSAAALLAALFNHFYIWVHYFATELPDIRRMYAHDVNDWFPECPHLELFRSDAAVQSHSE